MEASGGNPTGKRFGPWRSIIVHVSQLAQTHVQSPQRQPLKGSSPRQRIQSARRSDFRPRPRPTVARRHDVTGSEAWDRLRPGEASPPRPPGCRRLLPSCSEARGEGPGRESRLRLVTARAASALSSSPSLLVLPSGPAARLAASGRPPALLTDRRRPPQPAPPATSPLSAGARRGCRRPLGAHSAMRAPGSGAARLPQRRRPGPLASSVRPLWPRLLFLLLAAVGPVRAWESADLELFDLVEEVQSNLYEFLGVQQVSARAAAARTSSSRRVLSTASPFPQSLTLAPTSELVVQGPDLDGAASPGGADTFSLAFWKPSCPHPQKLR